MSMFGSGAPPAGTAPIGSNFMNLLAAMVSGNMAPNQGAINGMGGNTPLGAAALTSPVGGTAADQAAIAAVTNAGNALSPAGYPAGLDPMSQASAAAWDASGGNGGIAQDPNAYSGGSSPIDQQTLQQIISGIMGPAPTINDYYSAAPYQQALSTLAQGQTTGQSTINDAYSKAVSDFGNLQQQAQGQQATDRANLQQDNAAGQSQLQNLLQPASAVAAQNPQGELAARLSALQGTYGAQATRGGQIMDQIAALQNSNLGQAKAGLASQHQNANDQLASSMTSARNAVGAQQSAAITAGQKSLNAALASRQTRQDQMLATAQKAVIQAQKANATGQLTGRQQVQQQITQMAGDPNSAGVLGAFNTIINGDGNPNAPTGKPAHDAAEAIQRLNNGLAAAQAQGMTPQEAQALQAMVQGYYDTARRAPVQQTPADIQQMLLSMFGSGGR